MRRRGLVTGADSVTRCWWSTGDPLYLAYHDEEWGFPVADDRRLFEKLCLEGFQSGLSWLIILRKRENFRRAFAGFDIRRVARFGSREVARLIQDPGIVRHRPKVESVLNNARQALAVIREYGSLAALIWRYEPDGRTRPRRMTHQALMALTTSPESVALSRELKRRGWSYIGPTTVYAFMQAVGVVNDHLDGCDIRGRVEHARRAFVRPTAAPQAAAGRFNTNAAR